MALTVVASNSLTPVAGLQSIYSASTAGIPGPYIAVFDFTALPAATVAAAWSTTIPGASGATFLWRSDDFVVDVGVADGLVTPPVPVTDYAELYLDLITGTPAVVRYALYTLT